MNIINIEHISKIFGDKVIFQDASCGIQEGDKIGIIGINGTGKTTLLNIIGGLDNYNSGDLIINEISTKKYKDRDWDSYYIYKLLYKYILFKKNIIC